MDETFGPLAGIIKFLFDDPQSIRAWERGSAGERELAAALERRVGQEAVLIHDRRIPGTRANIDHLAIAPSGIWIIDAKTYQGVVERRDVGGWLHTDYRLYVRGRDRTPLVEGMTRQEAAVRRAVAEYDVAIHKAICFVDAEWKLFSRPFEVDGVLVTWGRDLAERISAPGQLSRGDVLSIGQRLAASLPGN